MKQEQAEQKLNEAFTEMNAELREGEKLTNDAKGRASMMEVALAMLRRAFGDVGCEIQIHVVSDPNDPSKAIIEPGNLFTCIILAGKDAPPHPSELEGLTEWEGKDNSYSYVETHTPEPGGVRVTRSFGIKPKGMTGCTIVVNTDEHTMTANIDFKNEERRQSTV